jgi:hypothetical protein
LQTEVTRFDQCQPGSQAADPALKAITNHPRRRELEHAATMNLALAEDLWKQDQKLCGAALNPNDAAERVLARLSKQ